MARRTRREAGRETSATITAWMHSPSLSGSRASRSTCVASTVAQDPDNLIERTPERDLLPRARALDLGVTYWSPLGSGVLTGKYNQSGSTRSRAEPTRREVTPYVRVDEHTLAIAAEVQQVAHEMGRTPAQVALNWIRQCGENLIPILGARKLSQLQEDLALPGVSAQRRADGAARCGEQDYLGFPYEMLGQDAQRTRDMLFAGIPEELIDQRRS